ncbi:MAG: bifunctional diaminohydroxyphosphoribosylaminopyrimidine deaminase/5-amino-6-(5-phosphoribosylamino)uracil reductase RibD [Hyphomicrobiales bacterium]|nr:bifunctional diaminohydroxyphosphoribosylaminopyrimidine deaminase/5-amino-6-(5-phosphoribosylamino)uracil reductase RibD [Hyphomicrobiales bacterium]
MLDQLLTKPKQTPAFSADDRRFMAMALALGRRNLGNTWPNPSVGAVIVADRPDGPVVVGRGWTARGGRPHGEPLAIAQAGDRAKGATCYVTLEPCAHHGRTTPCADALIEVGVSRVVAAIEDPDRRVAGNGFRKLTEAGIAVDVGLCRAAARRQHAGHISRILLARPHVQLKLAVSADGMIGRRGVGNLPITGMEARARVHMMRAEADAILIGIGTALADDPELTCRLDGLEDRSPVRVVVDGAARLPLASRLVATARDVPLWVVVDDRADAACCAALEDAGATIITVGRDAAGKTLLGEALAGFAERGITRLMVEGGAHIAEAMMESDFVDEIGLFSSTREIGADGLPAFNRTGPEAIAESGRFAVLERAELGGDLFTSYWRKGLTEG